LSKYKLENLNFGKVFHLPAFCLISGLAINFSAKDNNLIYWCSLYLVFWFAYFNFFWEKARRYLGLNQSLKDSTQEEMIKLFDEEGGINTDALIQYM